MVGMIARTLGCGSMAPMRDEGPDEAECKSVLRRLVEQAERALG